jgi:hypothetical protein
MVNYSLDPLMTSKHIEHVLQADVLWNANFAQFGQAVCQ